MASRKVDRCRWPRRGPAIVLLAAAAGIARAADVIPVFPTGAPQPIMGICSYDGDMYGVGKGNMLIRYDPATGEQLEVVSPLLPDPPERHLHGMAAAGGTFWIVDTITQNFYELSFSDYSIVSTVAHDAAPTHPYFGLTFQDGLLWAGHHSASLPTPVHAVDPETGDIVATLEFGAADVHGLAWVGGDLWVLDNATDEILRVDAAGEVMETFSLPDDVWYGLVWDGAEFWSCNLDMFYNLDLPLPPPGDVDGDGIVGINDFLLVIGNWGLCPAPCPPCTGDTDGDCEVGILDFLTVLGNWG